MAAEAKATSAKIEAEKDHIEVEIGDDDTSSYGSTCGSFTTSLSSSVFDYVYENGRRYTSRRSNETSEYIIPNDEKEQARLDLVHHLWGLLLRGRLYRAPLDPDVIEERCKQGKPFRILDLGTGTGIWAIDIGDEFPSAEVTGIDLSPIQPEWVPPNVKFEVDNFEDEWVFEHKFDYIHGRNLVGSIKDYPGLFKRIYENLAPGGIVEFQEHHVTNSYSEDNTLKESSPIIEYSKLLAKAGEAINQPIDVAPQLKSFFQEAGFVDVDEYKGKNPVGTWPKNQHQKELGMVCQEVMQTGVEAYALAALTRVLGWEVNKAKKLCDRVLDDYNDRRIHKIIPIYVVTGRKPDE